MSFSARRDKRAAWRTVLHTRPYPSTASVGIHRSTSAHNPTVSAAAAGRGRHRPRVRRPPAGPQVRREWSERHAERRDGIAIGRDGDVVRRCAHVLCGWCVGGRPAAGSGSAPARSHAAWVGLAPFTRAERRLAPENLDLAEGSPAELVGSRVPVPAAADPVGVPRGACDPAAACPTAYMRIADPAATRRGASPNRNGTPHPAVRRLC
eukprot:gene11238-13765_t